MERALLVTVDFGKKEGWTAEEQSSELKELASSRGAKVVKEVIVRRDRPDPRYYIGKGKAEEIAEACADGDIRLIIFNNDLTGTQQRSLEDMMMRKSIDRTQLILDIFASRAHSNEGKIQVELAQLLYLLPRLTGKGIYLSRLGGGIGTRGPGEQKLEVDRRRIRSRISHLKGDLEALSARRAMMRKQRERFSLITAAIIGYTNAGKSTLLNALTASDVVVKDKLFSTLDPTARRFILPNKQKILLVDTVGFLDRLPHHLIEAFKATLEEVAEADLLLHIIDISHPKAKEQSRAVRGVLEEIGARDKPVINVLNKIDKVKDDVAINRFKTYFDTTAAISALEKKGFDSLIEKISAHIRPLMVEEILMLAADDTKTLSLIYEHGLVAEREDKNGFVRIKVQLPERVGKILARRVKSR
jgi:GTP-binding protein HflX